MLRSILALGLVLAQPLAQPIAQPLATVPDPPPETAPGPPLQHHRPLRAAPTDRFRLPEGPFGPGNRGWEYVVAPGTPVGATAAGIVSFAGVVAGERYVSVEHADGLRSTYSYLAEIHVTTGAAVVSGQVLGLTSRRFQVGFRRGDTYIDPALLFGPLTARLVPDARFGEPAPEGV